LGCAGSLGALMSSITQPVIIPTATRVVRRMVSHNGASHTHSATTTPTHMMNAATRPIHFFITCTSLIRAV
jgi:hypothetical protein